MYEQDFINLLVELRDAHDEMTAYDKQFDMSALPETYHHGVPIGKTMVITAEQQIESHRLKVRYETALASCLDVGGLYRIPRPPPPVVST